ARYSNVMCKERIMYKSIPNRELLNSGKYSNMFREVGVSDFHEACEYVWKLPYGRTSERSNWDLVLSEGKGACSTKHALLKALSNELALDIDLVVGIYLMHENNTPGVGDVLSEYGLEYIPEAHCYLRHSGSRIDLTRHGAQAEEEIAEFLTEKVIEPQGIGAEKQEYHRECVRREFGEAEFDRVWSAREECISAIST
ncbi:hypothetical protein, partial [Enterovibrio norvegicus]|uniref:hypothetical protein n=1 Tax=Enterovibrio norvegicus TaxID=188144 RepID=UPI001C6113E6